MVENENRPDKPETGKPDAETQDESGPTLPPPEPPTKPKPPEITPGDGG